MRLRVDFNRVDDELTLPVWRLDAARSSATRVIDLDEGVRMVGEVVDVSEEREIEIGMRLRVDYRRIDDELTLPVWRRA